MKTKDKIKGIICGVSFISGFFFTAIAVGEGTATIMERLGLILIGFGLMLVPWLIKTWDELK